MSRMAECSHRATKLCGDVVKQSRVACALGFYRMATVFEAVVLAVYFKDVDMVGQPVKKRVCEGLRTEGAGPFIEG